MYSMSLRIEWLFHEPWAFTSTECVSCDYAEDYVQQPSPCTDRVIGTSTGTLKMVRQLSTWICSAVKTRCSWLSMKLRPFFSNPRYWCSKAPAEIKVLWPECDNNPASVHWDFQQLMTSNLLSWSAESRTHGVQERALPVLFCFFILFCLFLFFPCASIVFWSPNLLDLRFWIFIHFLMSGFDP